MKRNIEVREKELIDKLNESMSADTERRIAVMDIADSGSDRTSVHVWDNNGPIQFEDKCPMNKPCMLDAKHYYGDEIETVPNTISLSPRLPDGTIVPIEDFNDDPNDRLASKKASWDAIEKKCIDAMNKNIEIARLEKNEAKCKALAEVVSSLINKDTRMRTQIQPTDVPTDDYEYVNHPKHYNKYDVEVIDMMERIFGLAETYAFCKLNAFKYRMRAGTKPNITIQQDLDKEKWYLTRAEEIKSRMDTAQTEK